MIVAVAIDGYSSSSREPDLSDLVYGVTADLTDDYCARGWRARAFRLRQLRDIREYIYSNDKIANTLLVAGKSLGAKRAVQLWNSLKGIHYCRTALLTVDPNWPVWWDWTPNLNNRALRLAHPPEHAINVYVKGEPRQQCGALLFGPGPIENRVASGADHYSIVEHQAVRAALCELVGELKPR